jgi:hypothetical protein
MVESSERGSKPVTGRNLRPSSIGHVWAWIIIATCSVIFMSITMWVVSVGAISNDKLADREVVHRLAERMVERWPQVPGPSVLYAAQAKEAMGKGDAAEAALRSTMVLALDPNAEDSWLLLIVASSQPGFVRPILSVAESESILDAIEKNSGSYFDLQVAQGWLAFVEGVAVENITVPGGEMDTLAAALLRWQILGETANITVIERVLKMAPGYGPACLKRIAISRDEGDQSGEKKWTKHCLRAGVELVVMKSNGETLDSITVSP